MHTPSTNELLFKSWLMDHRGIIIRVTRSFARASTEAADLEQEIQLQLWNSMQSFAGKAKPSTWIYRVCLNTAMTWRRARIRRESKFDSDTDFEKIPTPGTSPFDTASDAEILEKLYAAIQAIPDFDRALVLLSLDGVSYHEIAEITGLTEGHVGTALTRARKRLANLMKGITNELE